MTSPIYGIDLGTTFTKCALVRPEDGVVRVFKLDADQKGSPVNTLELLRSAVSLTTEDGRDLAYVGSKAWSHFTEWDPAIDPPYRRFEESKMWIGESSSADGDAPPWPFAPHRWEYRPEDIGALVLRKVKREVEAERAPVMKRVVITHPQFFTEARREATRQAAALADLEIVDTLTEPDAAAIAFGRDTAPGTYMVFDLGGGTLDVTIVQILRDERTVVLTSDGERRGGRDWDRAIVERMMEVYAERFPGFSPELLDEATVQDWMRKAEQIKWQLTADTSPDGIAGERIQCQNDLFTGMRMQFRIRQNELERLAQPHVDACRRCAERALANKGLRWADLQGILLVGGSTRLRPIREMLSLASGHALNTNINPDTAVAQGAAIHAYRLAQRSGAPARGGSANASAAANPASPGPSAASAGGIAIALAHTGALARGLGVKAWDHHTGKNVIVNLIKKDSPLPTARAQQFETQLPNQTSIEVELWEGESLDPDTCEKLGACTLTGLEPERGRQLVDVTIEIHENGSKHLVVCAGGKRKEQALRFDESRVLPARALAVRASFIQRIEVR